MRINSTWLVLNTFPAEWGKTGKFCRTIDIKTQNNTAGFANSFLDMACCRMYNFGHNSAFSIDDTGVPAV